MTNSSTAAASFLDFSFNTADATEAVYARIRSDVEVNTNLAQGGDLSFHTANAGTVGEVMRLTQEGNVGIGTTSPVAKLEIAKGSEGLYLKVGGDNASNGRGLTFSSGSNNGSVGALHTINATSGNGAISLNTAGVSRLFLDRLGNVGIGTTSPSYKLHVAGNSFIDATSASAALTLGRYSGQPTIKAGTDDSGYMIIDSSGGIAALNWYSSDNVVLATGGGNVGIGTTSPSYKLDVRADDGSIGQVFIKGGNSTVSTIGEINSELLFGSNDGSVAQGNVGGKISSVTEASNGAYTGMAFYTYRQTSPLLTEKMRITHDGKIGS